MGTISEECNKKVTVLLASFRRERGKIVKGRGTGKGMYVCMCISMSYSDCNKQRYNRNIPKLKIFLV
jgi:hypothetical protein